MSFTDTQFWFALLQIIGINIVLSGDIGVGDLAHVIAHYAKEVGSGQIFLTDTARTAALSLGGLASDIAKLAEVPVSVVR